MKHRSCTSNDARRPGQSAINLSFATLIMRSIRYHWRLHLGLLAGTFIVCAALSGALVVGDSVRQTLYGIAEARLGNVGYALDWGNRYFESALADAMEEAPATKDGSQVVAALGLRGVVERPPDYIGAARRINRAWVYGVDVGFWSLAPDPASISLPGPQEALINEAMARTLSVEAGDDIVLRMPRPSIMPLDAPLARGGDSDTAVARARVLAVLTDLQWGRFSLSTDQTSPYNLFVDREWLGDVLELGGKANLLLADKTIGAERLAERLKNAWQLETIGLGLHEHPSGIVQLTSERIFIEEAFVRAAAHLGNARPTLSYLVNSISAGDRDTPYSFVVAGAAPKDTPEGAVCINQWLADALDVVPGDPVEISWSEPLPSGDYAERRAEARVHRVIPMEDLPLERDLAPRFPGLSDVDSCRDWDIGLPLDDDKLLDKENEAYWKDYGQTPKLLTSFETGSAWWGSRFGAVTAIRFDMDATNADALSQRLRDVLAPEEIGLVFLSVREQALQAVEQALDFGMLFVGMSIFLIAAALILLALLHVHGLQTRVREMGILLAIGWRRRRVATLLALESLPSLVAGMLLGAPGGVVYARLMLYGLVRFWPDAVAGTPLRYHASAAAMVQGALITVFCVLVVIVICVARVSRKHARELLEREFTSTMQPVGKRGFLYPLMIAAGIFGLLLSLYHALWASPDNPVVWFFLSGICALFTALAAYGLFLRALARQPAPSYPRLRRIMASQLARRGSRSLGVAAVTGCGVFMVLSVSAMQAAMTFEPEVPYSGAGGFSVFATTMAPVGANEEGMLGFSRDAIVPLRLWDGDDAGCLNLNRAQRPRLYGINPEAMISREAFAYPGEVEALWSLLDMPLEDGVVPALVGDTDTALWGLQAKTHPAHGTEFEYRDDAGGTFHVRTVGRLPMRLSLFQGALLISEDHFTRRFPHEGGYRAFLVNAPDAEGAAAQLNRDHGRLGMEAVTSLERLRAFHAVERAYLAMFLALGGLGLMLGAGGAAVVALRTLGERRAEFALFVAVGYEPRVVRHMALIENAWLVITGIIIGGAASTLAILPILLQARSEANLAALPVVSCALVAVYLGAVLGISRLSLARIPLSALRTE